jgi:hypothetical protein
MADPPRRMRLEFGQFGFESGGEGCVSQSNSPQGSTPPNEHHFHFLRAGEFSHAPVNLDPHIRPEHAGTIGVDRDAVGRELFRRR